MTYLPSGFASASVGSLRIDRSWRAFDTACSLKDDDFPLDRRLLEKLSLLNIIGRSVGWRNADRVGVVEQNHSIASRRRVEATMVIWAAFCVR